MYILFAILSFIVSFDGPVHCVADSQGGTSIYAHVMLHCDLRAPMHGSTRSPTSSLSPLHNELRTADTKNGSMTCILQEYNSRRYKCHSCPLHYKYSLCRYFDRTGHHQNVPCDYIAQTQHYWPISCCYRPISAK